MRMLKTWAVASLAAALFVSAPALADNITVKNVTGETKTTASKTIGGVDYVLHINADQTGALAPAATEAKLEAVRALLASPLAVTLSGGATAALQTTGNGKLDSLITNTTGLATSTLQGTANTKLDSLITNTTSIATSALQNSANTKLDSIITNTGAPTPAGTAIIGDVGSASFSVNCTVLTLPGTGGTYASGDLVANSPTPGSVTPLSCVLARYSGGPVTITKARLLTSTSGLTSASFRAHAYTSSPTVTNGNDGVYLSTASGHFCKLDVTLDVAFSDGAEGSGTPYTGSTCTRVLSATQTIYLLLEARAAYAWTAAQTVTVTLEGYN